ncbi:mammalian cell entry protein [Mycobacterium sp. Root265]|uniref:MCE family protein n=1 Tax=Mycobacterium sp. Root265 TaxID=1736504 RepID=UPI00070956A9|nr:MCE family protein [Mycobacterium sp. Root265]KRD06098.1 mammalian cell entry protein [Mycobacterium sp. Root265]
MKRFSERNPYIVGAVGVVIAIALVLGALQYKKLPFFNSGETYEAFFAQAGGLTSGAAVQVGGYRVGEVTGLQLDGAQVLVTFTVDESIPLGDRTEAAIKTKTLLGSKVLEVIPRGDSSIAGPIPLTRTTSPYQLPEALGDLTETISGLDTGQVSQSLDTIAQTFAQTPPDLKIAIQGAARFADTLNKRDAQLRSLLENARKATTVLRERTDQIVTLVSATNALLAELRNQSASLDAISRNISAASRELGGFIEDNNETLKPALEKLNGVLTIVDDRKGKVQESIVRLNAYSMSLGESVSSGPFFNAYISNLLPGQFVQPFVDAAFSDLGLDPNVLLPSQLVDPQVGQPGTPALPAPFPRTGQGGEPRLTVPDAITGNAGDQACGAPGAPTPGPGCYPYRKPLPAPAPGGPPPGPPAPGTAEIPLYPPIFQQAPGEPSPQQMGPLP